MEKSLKRKNNLVQFVPKKDEFTALIEKFVKDAGGEEETDVLLIGVRKDNGAVLLAANCVDDRLFTIIALLEYAKNLIMLQENL